MSSLSRKTITVTRDVKNMVNWIGRTFGVLTCCLAAHLRADVPTGYSHIFLILLENVGYEAVIGNTTDAPYINNILLPQGTLYTNSYSVAHPSLPNYLALFSGSTQGVTNDNCTLATPPNGPFNATNLYTELTNAGFTVKGYMETMPFDGYLGCKDETYVQKHNPFPFFTTVPNDAWVVYKGPYNAQSAWPNFTFITPNLIDDMHNGATVSIKVSDGDTWLSNHLPPLISYANSNNGLIILTMDEGRKTTNNHIPTILVGPGITPGGINFTTVNHYNTIKTITNNFGVAALGNSVGLPVL